MNLKNYILFFIYFFAANFSSAQKATQNEINKIAENFLIKLNHTELLSKIPNINKIYSEKTNELLCFVFNYEHAFIVISADKSNIPVKAFSFKHKLNLKKNTEKIHFIDILKSDYEQFNKLVKNNSYWTEANYKKWYNLLLNVNEKNITDETFGPFLSSLYGQVNCHDNNGHLVNVTNYYTPNHYAVGCVAMTFTEVMRYYNWPRIGVGNYSYSDTYGNSTGSYSANFEEKYYNWDLMQDRYDGVSSTNQQRSELGKLAFHAAVSVRMDFENGGSTSNINRIPNAASKYFRYIAEYKEKSTPDFWKTLDTSLHHSIPAQFAVYTSSDAGHAVVGDGIKYLGSEKYYHLNMGWWGNDNGWYQIHQSFNAGGYTNVTAAVLNMIPVPEMDNKPELNKENMTINLKWYFSNKLIPEKYELQMKKGAAEWETVTDTIETQHYLFSVDGENDYTFRIRAKINGQWKENSWSDEIKIIPSDFKASGDKELKLYPTVAYDELKVSYEKLSGSIVKIYNISGNIVFSSLNNVSDNEYKINVLNLESGIYILQMKNETENKTAKFLKL